MGKKFVTYEQAVQTFLERGFCLTTSRQMFEEVSLKNVKLDCYCIKHPDFKTSIITQLLSKADVAVPSVVRNVGVTICRMRKK